eukprot:7315175-Prymnesium_polylepis.1
MKRPGAGKGCAPPPPKLLKNFLSQSAQPLHANHAGPPLRAGRQSQPSRRCIARRRPRRPLEATGSGCPPLHPPQRATDTRTARPGAHGGCRSPPRLTL